MGKLIQVLGTWINMQHHDNCNPSKVIYSQNKKKTELQKENNYISFVDIYSLN